MYFTIATRAQEANWHVALMYSGYRGLLLQLGLFAFGSCINQLKLS